SLVVAGGNGRSVEIGVTGKEGFTPIPLLVGLNRSPHRAVIQVAGEGFKVGISILEELLRRNPRMRALLTRYAIVHGLQTAQTGGCNRLHNLEQRLARW